MPEIDIEKKIEKYWGRIERQLNIEDEEEFNKILLEIEQQVIDPNEENLFIKSYDSKANGTVEKSGGVFQFSSITNKVRVGISFENDRSRVEKMMKKVERACLITNSIRTDVNIESDISIF